MAPTPAAAAAASMRAVPSTLVASCAATLRVACVTGLLAACCWRAERRKRPLMPMSGRSVGAPRRDG
jgi:hypothetical protein